VTSENDPSAESPWSRPPGDGGKVAHVREASRIEWTFNPWWGCAHVSAGCAHCDAEALARRYGHDVWGARDSRCLFERRTGCSRSPVPAPTPCADAGGQEETRDAVRRLTDGVWTEALLEELRARGRPVGHQRAGDTQ
jgi:hypothetical protein